MVLTQTEQLWAREWINALRSGEHMQTFGEMHSNDGERHCAIGVLDLITDEPGRFRNAITFKPWPFGEWLTDAEIMGLNDDDGCPFEGIADYIETKLAQAQEDERRRHRHSARLRAVA